MDKAYKIERIFSFIYRWRWIIIFLVFWIIIFLNIPCGFFELGGDSAQYIILAESIVKGCGYRAINFPNSPFFYHYPPIFPLLLTPIIYFLGRNFYFMHILVAFLGFLGLIFSYFLFKKYVNDKKIFFIVLLSLTNWTFIRYASFYILSDIPYFFFSFFTLFFISLYIETSKAINREGILSVLGLLLCYFTRYIGLVLFLSTILAIFFCDNSKAKLKKIAFVFFGFAIPFLMWQIIAYKLEPSLLSNYSKQFFLIDPYRPYLGTIKEHPQAIFIRLVNGINYYYQKVAEVLFLWFSRKSDISRDILSFISLFFIFLGIYKRRKVFFLYYLFVYILLIILWPFREGVRFLLPIIPFLYFYLIEGLEKIIKRNYLSIFLIFLTLLNLIVLPPRSYSSKDLPPSLRNFLTLHYWIKRNLPREGVILSRKPTITYFFTGHKSVNYHFTLNPTEIWREIKKEKVKYIIIDEFSKETYHYLLPFAYRYKDKLKLLYRIGNTGIFEVLLD